MIVMDLKVDNFLAFKNFHINMSYPKKIVDSYIPDEFLEDRPNFRYKKVNILMGANASGKTSIGNMLMYIFNFMHKKGFERITESISETNKTAFFSIDFVVPSFMFYRVVTRISPRNGEEYSISNIDVCVKTVVIGKKDSYESCVKRIENITDIRAGNYIEELEKIKGLSWLFEYPSDFQSDYKIKTPDKTEKYIKVLDYILRALDPSIRNVSKLEEVENTFVIWAGDKPVVMQDGKLVNTNILSSGTKSGIEIASFITSILEGECSFYYCDEKFSYIHSDMEKAFLAVMIQKLKSNNQLFFTTHNTDILDLKLPMHSFSFLIKDCNNKEEPIKCVSASQFLKRNTDSLRNAVDNDLFSASPNLNLIYAIEDIE